jgi:hypothetical protein
VAWLWQTRSWVRLCLCPRLGVLPMLAMSDVSPAFLAATKQLHSGSWISPRACHTTSGLHLPLPLPAGRSNPWSDLYSPSRPPPLSSLTEVGMPLPDAPAFAAVKRALHALVCSACLVQVLIRTCSSLLI